MSRYQSIHEVPRRWRSLQGTQLSLGQIELILDRTEASKKPFAIAYGEAKRDFKTTHQVAAGHWVETKTKEIG